MSIKLKMRVALEFEKLTKLLKLCQLNWFGNSFKVIHYGQMDAQQCCNNINFWTAAMNDNESYIWKFLFRARQWCKGAIDRKTVNGENSDLFFKKNRTLCTTCH